MYLKTGERSPSHRSQTSVCPLCARWTSEWLDSASSAHTGRQRNETQTDTHTHTRTHFVSTIQVVCKLIFVFFIWSQSNLFLNVWIPTTPKHQHVSHGISSLFAAPPAPGSEVRSVMDERRRPPAVLPPSSQHSGAPIGNSELGISVHIQTQTHFNQQRAKRWMQGWAFRMEPVNRQVLSSRNS